MGDVTAFNTVDDICRVVIVLVADVAVVAVVAATDTAVLAVAPLAATTASVDAAAIRVAVVLSMFCSDEGRDVLGTIKTVQVTSLSVCWCWCRSLMTSLSRPNPSSQKLCPYRLVAVYTIYNETILSIYP